MASRLVNITDFIATIDCEFTNYLMFQKQQSYMTPELEVGHAP